MLQEILVEKPVEGRFLFEVDWRQCIQVSFLESVDLVFSVEMEELMEEG
jgi:hypothetical protein